MATLLGFRVWYVDGSVVTGMTFEDWKAAPDDGVLVINVYRSDGRTIWTGCDWYQWQPFTPYGMSGVYSSEEFDGTDEPKPGGCQDCIKHGVGVSAELYAEAEAKAMEDVWR